MLGYRMGDALAGLPHGHGNDGRLRYHSNASSRGYGVITSESVEFLESGKTKRSEVLLTFGHPNQLADDRYFVYRWKRTHAWVGTYGGGGDIRRDHYLAMEFSSENRLKRFKLIEPWLFQNPDTQLKEWIAQTDDPSKGKG
jgi:outer membrane protein assembly factor BamE (lipoprotein component of BamABCDE complex)